MISAFGGEVSIENQRRDELRIQKRRERDDARRRTFLNAKTRLMGVDRSALDLQVAELKMKKKIEREADMAYANRMNDIKNILEERNMQEHEAKIEDAMKTRAVWDVQKQQYTERSTFDLNDPNELKKRPKWTDDDVIGPSSLRRFAGEDLHFGDRKKIQAAQMKDWITQLETEKLIKKQEEQKEALTHHQYLMEVEKVREEMHRIELEQKLEENYNYAQQNIQLAAMRTAEKEQEVLARKKLDEIHNKTIENNPMLREARDQAKSVVPGRVRRDHWKGMTVSQIQAIQAQNLELIVAKQNRKAYELQDEVRIDIHFLFHQKHNIAKISLITFFFFLPATHKSLFL
jgi:hypothetical protein